jgi:hypothetical protein
MTTEVNLQHIMIVTVRPIWGRFDHERPRFDATHVWTILSLVALIIGLAVVSYRSSRRTKRHFDVDSPTRLFRELCRAHRLSFGKRRLLKRLAAVRSLSEPALLFVEPRHFDIAHLPDELRQSAEEIWRLRDRLFR